MSRRPMHVLRDVKYLGGWERLASLARGERRGSGARRRASTALRAAAAAGAELRRDGRRAVGLGAGVGAARVRGGTRAPARARRRVVRAPPARARGHSGGAGVAPRRASPHDDEPVAIAELAGTVRRWIEGQTFSPRTGTRGLMLLDAPAAAYADVDEMRLVGLVESDWPERSRRSIFYPSSLLAQLGWPADADRLAAARARFQDLLRLARTRVSVSLFTLEDDAIVPPSPFLEEVDAAGLPIERTPPPMPSRVFVHEALADEPVVGVRPDWRGRSSGWRFAPRGRLPPAAVSRRRRRARGGVYAVSHLERYLECPFKYFAAHVLRLPEERDEEAGLTPQERGQFLHEVFEASSPSGRRPAAAHHDGERRRRARALRARRRGASGDAARSGPRAGADAPARLGRRPGPRRARVRVRDRAGRRGRRAAARARARGAVRVRDGRRPAHRAAARQGGSHRSAGRRHAPRRRLQARQGAEAGACAAAAGLRRVRAAVARGAARPLVDARPRRLRGVPREERVRRRSATSTSLLEAVGDGQERLLGGHRRDRARRVSAEPDEPFLCTRCGYASVCRKDYVGDE